MTTDRFARPGPGDLALKMACRDAVLAAGGQEFVAGEVGRAQSRISDYLSPNTADYMPIDVVRKVEALGAGRDGHPHITRALARAQGLLAFESAPRSLDHPLTHWLAQVAGESGDVIKALASGLVAPGMAAQSIGGMPLAQRAELAREIDQLVDVLAGISALLLPER